MKIIVIDMTECILMSDIKTNQICVNFIERGEKGHTPTKGIDYFTQEDKEEIINQLQFGSDIDVISNEDLEKLF